MGQRTEQAETLQVSFGFQPRKHRRKEVAGFLGDVTAGGLVAGCEVRDVSRGGFRVRDLAAKYKSGKYFYTVVLSGHGRHFRMLATPCWEKVDPVNNQTETGFKILDCSLEWIEFVQNIFDKRGVAALHA
jgi:hypothetical protein